MPFKLYVVVSIQVANRQRVIAAKNRLLFFDYYWENMKVDMSKILLSDTKSPEVSKQLSIKIFSINKDTKV